MALRRSSITDQVTYGAIPLHSIMDYKLASSRRPAQAVGYPAQGRGADGDGGGTAGTSLVGVVAASVPNSQICEIPHPAPPRRSAAGSNRDPPPPAHGSGQTSAPKRTRGRLPDGAEAEPEGPPLVLTRKPFKIATWNLCGQGTYAAPKSKDKMRLVEHLLTLESIDILILTETHTTSLPVSRRVQVLDQTGLAHRAGVAIVTKAGSGWDVLHKEVIVPGYAVMVKASHRVSRESLWVLGVYGDTSRGQTSLVEFYERLSGRMEAFVRRQARTHWGGCFAAGDWNFVEYAGDRFPTAHPDRAPVRLLAAFNSIKELCGFVDTAGTDPVPSLWSYRKMTAHGEVYSRLDRIYRPRLGWSAGDVQPIDTGASDHRLVAVPVYPRKPKIEKAKPAPRLPSLEALNKAKKFWPTVLLAWDNMTSLGPVTLEKWAAFKESVLEKGLAEVKAMKASGRKDWIAALKRELIPPDQIMGAVTKANRQLWAPCRPPARTAPKWPSAIPAYEAQPQTSKHFVASETSPWQVPIKKPSTTTPTGKYTTVGFMGPAHEKGVASLLKEWADKLDASTKAKWEKMTRTHSSEWFKQSSNKELDERGSRASVSVEGLRRPGDPLARTDLAGMTEVAEEYFRGLHTPERTDEAREAAQQALLEEVRLHSALRPDPSPEDISVGPFSREEMEALTAKMLNTAPGPDGIHYDFWKQLIRLLAGLQSNDVPPRTFWSAFADLTKDIAERGSSRVGFKDANISLFYKKGDPTLVSNYRPISSMNTDCKMYTNLINMRLAPWAVAKLHPDQKGFVPGRLMNEHTRLASEVAHLCDVTGTPGFIVGLDQAKAYNRVDQPWLLQVLVASGLPPDLILLISDLTSNCRSRVRINSGYSPYFVLKRGVRQGDPLSCLLFNFSIEPLAIRLRQVVKGLSVPGLKPMKIMLYADDVNLFLGREDSVRDVSDCLASVSETIGSKFNLDKTDVKPVGPHDFQLACYTRQDMDGSSIPGAHILPPADPLRVLGVWIGSRDFATDRWIQIDRHIKKIISQWRAIGASAMNRSLLAKALMLSRCHFLMDGNGIPPGMINKIGNKIMNFVRGKFSAMAYRTLEAPLAEGGLNTPSLASRKMAADLKFLSDLVTGDQNVPWKQWTWMDLKMASTSSRAGSYGGLNPFLQQAYTMPSLLQDRVSQAFQTARRFGLDMVCATPSNAARMNAFILNHPALPRPSSQRFKKLLELKKCGVSKVIHLYAPPPLRGTGLKRTVSAMKELVHASSWSPLRNLGASGTHPGVNVWPEMNGPLGCIRIFTAPKSLIVGRVIKDAYKKTRVRHHMVDYAPTKAPALRRTDPIVYERDIHVWTDGSAKDNGTDVCTAGSAWVSDIQLRDAVSLTGATLSNNVAEVAAVVLCLMAWRDAHVVIHTDSTYVLGLLGGGLLAMERDGWGDAPRHLSRGPPVPLLRTLLYLLRDRTGRLQFEKAKAHGDDVMNNLADKLANEGREEGRVLDIGSLAVPEGWVDTAPVLCHQPLDYLTRLVIRARMGAPAKTLKFEAFSDRWMVTLGHMFGVVLDPGNYIKEVWHLAIPEGLKEVLWKEMNGAQVLGHRYHGRGHERSDMGRFCPCGREMALGHVLVGCEAYVLQPLMEVLLAALGTLHPSSSFKTLSPDSWGASPWYPLLALGSLEELAYPIVKGRKKILKGLKKSRQRRTWMIGTYYWALWKWRMKEVHDTGFNFVPANCAALLRDALALPVPEHLLTQEVGGEGDKEPPGVVPNQKPAPLLGDLTKLPPPMSHLAGRSAEQRLSDRGKSILRALRAPGAHELSHLTGRSAEQRLSDRGKSILRALRAPGAHERPHHLPGREAVLRALTDNAYT